MKQKALRGEDVTVDEALELNARYTTDELADAADDIRVKWCGDVIDTCSIVNARSGLCGEDCKWCAQSRHYATGVDRYERVSADDAVGDALHNEANGVKRYSLVTSGRRVTANDMPYFCSIYREIADRSDIYLCASMGLLDRDGLLALKDARVKRYHCNLEASDDYFNTLCSTHSHADKLRTIAMAREVGLEICCGGIIGMGESMRQRLELARECGETGAVSVPINILNPFPGTPLEDMPLISEDEIVRTVALFRFMLPKLTLRFAGGRKRLSSNAVARILRGGMNGVLVGDMLNSVGNNIARDRQLFESLGYRE
ncbi:MAG: biotin synthase BioB [Pseudoflavonifractor sp.]|nr:biotin synthase BioB [Pseudoflavonifractor sp.]